MTNNQKKTFWQFIRFGIVGVSNTIVSVLIYDAALFLFRQLGVFSEYDYFVAQVVMFMLSILWSFYWNNKFVFTDQGRHTSIWSKLIKTYITYSFSGILLSSILLYVWVELLDISPFIAPIINSIINVPVNFFINKYWSFAD